MLVRAVAAKTLLIDKMNVMPREATEPAARLASWFL